MIYRPGLEAVTSAFFDDLSETLDRTAGYCDLVYIVGDLNVRLDRTDDASSRQLTELLKSMGSLSMKLDRRTSVAVHSTSLRHDAT